MASTSYSMSLCLIHFWELGKLSRIIDMAVSGEKLGIVWPLFLMVVLYLERSYSAILRCLRMSPSFVTSEHALEVPCEEVGRGTFT